MLQSGSRLTCWGPQHPFPTVQGPGPLRCEIRPPPSFGCPPATPPRRPKSLISGRCHGTESARPWQREPPRGVRLRWGGGCGRRRQANLLFPGCLGPISPGWEWGPHRGMGSPMEAKWAGSRRASAVWTDPPARGLPQQPRVCTSGGAAS